jgi:hypothetical protein
MTEHSYSDVRAADPTRATIGCAEVIPEGPPPPAPRIFVFLVTTRLHGGVPRVVELPDTQEGHEELVALVRGEQVLAVVRGHRATVTNDANVRVRLENLELASTMTMQAR